MASNGAGQRPGSSSFLSYMVNQRAKAGRGLQEIDNAIGAPQPNPNAGAGVQTTPQAPTMPEAPAAQNPPTTLGAPQLLETQPPPLRLLDTDRYYRAYGRLPTAAELAANEFATRFREQEGRAPTKQEVVAHLYRRPEKLPQVTEDFTVA